jgi:hypothetical protein
LIEKHLAWDAPGVMPLYEENGTYVGYVNIAPEKNAGAKELCPVDRSGNSRQMWS